MKVLHLGRNEKKMKRKIQKMIRTRLKQGLLKEYFENKTIKMLKC